jgi:hypothetical protein
MRATRPRAGRPARHPRHSPLWCWQRQNLPVQKSMTLAMDSLLRLVL